MPILVKLTMSVSRDTVTVNMSNVVAIMKEKDGNGSILRYADGWKMTVKESMDDILLRTAIIISSFSSMASPCYSYGGSEEIFKAMKGKGDDK